MLDLLLLDFKIEYLLCLSTCTVGNLILYYLRNKEECALDF